MFAPFLNGLRLGAGLIVVIGAQNAFVLRQGLRRRHVFLVATVCVLIDMSLIAAGAGGFGTLVAAVPALTDIAALGGALFLVAYGLRALRAAIRPGALELGAGTAAGPREAVLTALALSLLNPHVYLDTVVLLGGLAGQYAEAAERLWFAIGAMTASALWFYALGYGAAGLAPLFARPIAWRLLDLGVAAVMFAIAAALLRPYLAAF